MSTYVRSKLCVLDRPPLDHPAYEAENSCRPFVADPCIIEPMKRRQRNDSDDLAGRFQTTCGWCGQRIPPNVEVFGGGGKFRADVDFSSHAGHVLPVRVIRHDKTVLVAVTGLDSEARRDGHDFVSMTCSEECALSLRSAFEDDIELGQQAGLP